VNRKKYTNALCNQTAENLSIKLHGPFPKLSFERLNTMSLPSTKLKFYPLFPSHSPWKWQLQCVQKRWNSCSWTATNGAIGLHYTQHRQYTYKTNTEAR